jgi:hypothetical protein
MTPVAIGGQRSVVVAAVVVSHKPITRSGGDVLLHQCDQVPWGIDVRFGQKQTSISEGSMSALPPKTDIHRHDGDVRLCQTRKSPPK